MNKIETLYVLFTKKNDELLLSEYREGYASPFKNLLESFITINEIENGPKLKIIEFKRISK